MRFFGLVSVASISLSITSFWAQKYILFPKHQGFPDENIKKSGENAVYRLAESDWMNVNVGDQIFITAKRSGSDPYISDEKGNRIADLVKEK